jgi:hypothetical protein
MMYDVFLKCEKLPLIDTSYTHASHGLNTHHSITQSLNHSITQPSITQPLNTISEKL